MNILKPWKAAFGVPQTHSKKVIAHSQLTMRYGAFAAVVFSLVLIAVLVIIQKTFNLTDTEMLFALPIFVVGSFLIAHFSSVLAARNIGLNIKGN